jgi:hypothetical protein
MLLAREYVNHLGVHGGLIITGEKSGLKKYDLSERNVRLKRKMKS